MHTIEQIEAASPPGACVYLAAKRDGSGESAWHVRMPRFLPQCDGIGEMLDVARREKAADRDHFLALQKEAGAARDRDMARFWKEEAADALKEYRALCLVIPYYVAQPPGDCPYRPEWEWPTELAPWIDRVIWRITSAGPSTSLCGPSRP